MRRRVALYRGLAAGILEAHLHQLSIRQQQRLVSETQEDREATGIFAVFRVGRDAHHFICYAHHVCLPPPSVEGI